MKLDDIVATVQESLVANGASKDLIAKTLKDIRKAAEAEAADRKASAGPKAKTQLNILVSDPEGKLAGLSLVGFVVQTEEASPPQEAYHRILAAAHHFNSSKRGSKAPLETLGDAMEVLRGKHLKQERPEQKLVIKSRSPIAVQAVPNALPK